MFVVVVVVVVVFFFQNWVYHEDYIKPDHPLQIAKPAQWLISAVQLQFVQNTLCIYAKFRTNPLPWQKVCVRYGR